MYVCVEQKKKQMEIYNLPNDVKVFGFQVKTFPAGIGEAFDGLLKMVGGFNRSFYGISYMMADGNMAYYATAEEAHDGEAEEYDRERFTIEKGKYLSISIKEWRNKTGTIKNIFY